MVQQVQVQCSSCNGEGEVMDEKNRCVDCKGKKVLPERKVLEVHIDKGAFPSHPLWPLCACVCSVSVHATYVVVS